MNKRIKKKYTDRVFALVESVRHESTDYIEVYHDSITAKGKAFKRCWGWMCRQRIFEPMFEGKPRFNPHRRYCIELTETETGILYACVVRCYEMRVK